ncbi:MAG: DUF1684 domain-containing protein [Flavisolibacter sp.]
MKSLFLPCFLLTTLAGLSQNNYTDSLKAFQKEYVETHEVVKGADRQGIHFFTIDPLYRIRAGFERKKGGWFEMQTSGPLKKLYRTYGVLHFTFNHQTYQLNVYQSQDLLQREEYKTFLFLPFTDQTTGKETYHGGRYLDIRMEDIQNGTVVLDFNRAYNPYCAYVTGKFNCPLPPKENQLSLAIRAGEKDYRK